MASVFDVATLAMMKHLGFPQSNDYDMPGFTEAYLNFDPRARASSDPHDKGRIHYTDPWKLPSHPSFSNESIYAGSNAPQWKTYDTNPAANTFDYWRATPEQRKEYWRLESPSGDPVSWDSPWAQGPSTQRLNEIKDFSRYGIYDMNKEGLSAMLRYGK
jgi:hypothetical protein